MRDKIDAILEDAVKSYADVEPSPELAASILKLAQQEPLPKRKSWRLALAFAVPLAAAVMAFLLIGRLSLPRAPTVVAVAPAVPEIPHPQAQSTIALPPSHSRAHAHRFEEARPLSDPYSKQELALLALVERHPKEAAAIAKAQHQPLEPLTQQPITISHLEIKPLTIAPLDQEK